MTPRSLVDIPPDCMASHHERYYLPLIGHGPHRKLNCKRYTQTHRGDPKIDKGSWNTLTLVTHPVRSQIMTTCIFRAEESRVRFCICRTTRSRVAEWQLWEIAWTIRPTTYSSDGCAAAQDIWNGIPQPVCVHHTPHLCVVVLLCCCVVLVLTTQCWNISLQMAIVPSLFYDGFIAAECRIARWCHKRLSGKDNIVF
jgi:hypothetical protein